MSHVSLSPVPQFKVLLNLMSVTDSRESASLLKCELVYFFFGFEYVSHLDSHPSATEEERQAEWVGDHSQSYYENTVIIHLISKALFMYISNSLWVISISCLNAGYDYQDWGHEVRRSWFIIIIMQLHKMISLAIRQHQCCIHHPHDPD